MGNSTSEIDGCYCCSKKVIDTFFSLNELHYYKYDITLIQLYSNNGCVHQKEEKIINKIENIEGIIQFIDLINKILNNINKFTIENISDIKNIFNNFLSEFLTEKELMFYLSNINNIIQNNLDIKAIKECSKLFQLIYNRRHEINIEDINYFIKSIYYILKKENNEIEFFKVKLKEIFLKEYELNIKKKLIPRNKKEENNKITSKYQVETNCISNNDNFSKNLSRCHSFSSIFSNKNIPKLEKEEEEEINELISLGEDKQLLELIFLDETQKEEFPLSININKNDTFSFFN